MATDRRAESGARPRARRCHRPQRRRAAVLLAAIAVGATLASVALAQETAPLLVPRGATALLDGDCADFDDGVAETFADAGGATGVIRFKHDDDWLWVCVSGAAGLNETRTAALYLDPRGDGGAAPTADDAELEVAVPGTTRVGRHGDGGAWVPRPGIDPFWTAQAVASRTGDAIEYAVSIRDLRAGACGLPLGLAFVHAGVNGTGDDHAWPEGAVGGEPASWRTVALESPACTCGGTFRVTADAEVRESDPGLAFGTQPDLWVARPGEERRALLGFDLTASIPQDATVTSAVLELPLAETNGEPLYTLRARRLDRPWDEPTVTWDAQPPPGEAYAEETFDVASGTLHLDVTTLVRGWTTRSIREQSLALTTPTTGAELRFLAREALASPGPARIVVSCAAPAPDVAEDSSAADAAQDDDLARLAAASTVPVRFLPGDRRGGVRSASFAVPIPAPLAPDGATRARWFLEQYRDLLRTPDPAVDWQLVRRSEDDRHLVFRQRLHGIPVFPAQLVVHLDADEVVGLSGRYAPGITRDPDPRLPAVQAEAIALAGSSGRPRGLTSLVYLDRALLGEDDPRTHLAWAVELDTETAYVDADSGELLDRISKVQEAERWVLDLDHFGPTIQYSGTLVGECWYYDGNLWFNQYGMLPWAQPDGEGWNAYDALGKTYFWYLWSVGRNSWNGFGGSILMAIHSGTQQSWIDAKKGWPNAYFWSPCAAIEFSDLTPHDDVTGHEFTHGVTHWSAGLVYKNQSGALNESFSDVFGQFVDPEDWTMGEDLTGGPWRDLSNPPAFLQPDRFANYNQKIDADNDGVPDDNGGVHRNSGIPNKAAYLVNVGGLFQGMFVQGIGPYKTHHLWYRMLTAYLSSGSQFLDARNASLKAAEEFVAKHQYGFTTYDVCSAQNAWAAVGVGSGDLDCDGVDDDVDPDNDGDGWPDTQDNCPGVSNVGQANSDSDSLGDACDGDADNDGVPNDDDDCPLVADTAQHDTYGGPKGDVCDDTDGDGVVDAWDNCPTVPNPKQENADADYHGGDACDADADNDAVPNDVDNCPLVKNYPQQNADGDAWGDACDLCPAWGDPDNGDIDGDGKGNPCDDDVDGDGILNDDDNCPLDANPSQTDLDGNGVGMACDPQEQDDFIHDAVGGLTVPVTFGPGPNPLALPLAIGPAGGPEELPAGTTVVATVDLPIQYLAAIVGSDGNTYASTGPVQGLTTLQFQPPAFGGTFYQPAAGAAGAAGEGAGAVADAAAFPSTLLVPPPDQIRFALRITPLDPVSPGEPFDLYVRSAQGAAPDVVAHEVADRCAGTGAGDGVVDPGDDATLAVTIGQVGSLAASGVSARLATTTPGVTVTRSTAAFPDLPATGGARSAEPDFEFAVDGDVACGTAIDFALEVATASSRAVRHFTHTVGATLHGANADAPLAIPDGGTATSPIEFARTGVVADVDVTVFVAHPDVGELELTLVAPDGTRVPLLTGEGAGADLDGTTFDDEATDTLATFAPPAPYRLQPEVPLAVLDGIEAAGAWSLEVVDGVRGGGQGTLERWSLAIELERPACGSCEAATPGEVATLFWSSASALAWTAAPGASWYNLYQGSPEELPALLEAAPDSCRRWFGEATTTGEVLLDTPAPGQWSWYLARAASTAGEGPAGTSTSGPRSQDTSGECP